ncbi:hypothetical protein H4582DRAFT_1114143 [Lactarius indigo]|nr:hypothetical protein H4582DRAFT_1114143 [Lactarius indigo]
MGNRTSTKRALDDPSLASTTKSTDKAALSQGRRGSPIYILSRKIERRERRGSRSPVRLSQSLDRGRAFTFMAPNRTFYTLMVHFRLWYFIEGTCGVHCVIISKYKYVANLQREIHSQSEQSHFNGVPSGDLALLKDLRAPDDAETLGVTQRIRDLWRRQPDSEPLHLHICVRRPSMAMSELLDAAQHLHCNL